MPPLEQNNIITEPVKKSYLGIIFSIIALLVLVFGVSYFLKSKPAENLNSSGVIEDLKQAPGLLDGKPISKNAPVNWGATLCDYFTLEDAKAVLGPTAYLPKDGFTANVCGYHVPNGGSSFVEPKASVVVMFRSITSDTAKVQHDAFVKAGYKDVSGIGEWVVVKETDKGNVSLYFLNNGVMGGINVNNFGVSDKNTDKAIAIAKLVLPKFPK